MLNSTTVRRQRGLSIVELLVGVALGLFLVAGAVTMFVTNLGSSRQLLSEARVNQDLRAAADLITRDLRRAGYWENSLTGTVATGAGSTTVANQYRTITTGSEIVEYTFARDTNDTVETNENFGFRRQVVNGVGVIQMKLGATNWTNPQTVTDPQTMDVTAMTVAPNVVDVSARDACAITCCSDADVTAGTCATRNIAAGASCPIVRVRQYTLTIAATAIGNNRVTRTLQTRLRPRNDELAGVCP
jgi:prepilin peptidase dependent protein B